ncbi:P-type E1-E2 ATPase [Paenibacillus mucilaginosus]|uniref:ATPase P n=1 Tax=Paenibacillus mucilaginosus TaxID=61624 RepID=UPI003D1E3B96
MLKSDKNGSKVEFEFTFNGTAMFAAVEGSYAGPVAVIDTLKEKSKESVGRLKALGIEVIMITGDNRRTGETIVGEVNIDRVHSS